jgi:hypothetical protein
LGLERIDLLLFQWQDLVEAPPGAATQSPERDAKHARRGISDVTKRFRNGRFKQANSYHHTDESSRNCTKHQVRCDYQDSPAALLPPESPKSPQQPNLLWTAEIDATIEQWRQTGVWPFDHLSVYPQPQWRAFPKTDLRLVHHVATISNEMFSHRTSKLTLWTDMMPK